MDCAILIALGVDPQGKRTILGVSAALILIRFQYEANSGRVQEWQDHAGLIHSS